MARTARFWRLIRYGGLTAALLGLAPGCYSPCGRCRDGKIKELTPDVMPAPLGTFVHGWTDTQAAKAEASDFTIFNDEWYMGGARLGPHGQAHLRNIILRLPSVPFPVVLQPHVDETLNQARRNHVVSILQNNGIVDAEQRVVVDIPQAEGLSGDEAERIYLQGYTPNHWGHYNRGYGGSLGGGFNRGWGGWGGLGGWGGVGAPGFWGGFGAGIW